MVLAHEAHAQVDIILGWKMNTRTRNLRTVEEHVRVTVSEVAF